ncbi:MAG TPA: iron-containing alcohol dehydrogenase [Levilinea sp.]|nr:iron-containing alcohol dehydrogenase [Levilinea sp.]
MNTFRYQSHAQEVIFGAGSLSRLPELLARSGLQRAMLVSSRSYRANGRVDEVAALLGSRLAAVCDDIQPHVQDWQRDGVLATAQQREVDAIVALGGGSPIGMAKAAAHAYSVSRPAVIAIPTTYSGSEMTPVFGVTHTGEEPLRKVTVDNPAIVPRLVIYDPELALDLPPNLTASSGVNALAHCIEALYSITRHPLSTAAALDGLRRIFTALPRCHAHGDDLEARTALSLGAHLAGLSLSSVKLGLHHGICHVLGGSAGVPHGIANGIILPHAMRFNAPVAAGLLLPAAAAMGIPVGGLDSLAAVEAAAGCIHALVASMNLPQRLRDVGVPESELPRLGRLAYENHTVQSNPRPVVSPAQMEAFLWEVW